jgi:peptidoglycan hydrolase-like protein with peptidoglycan-binding domain
MHSFKKAAAVGLMIGMIMPAIASAQTTSTTSLQALLTQIATLQAQIKTAQQQQQVAFGQLLVTLNQGSKGENVKLLQQLLASDPSIYPEGTISGFFGPLTAKAVKRFQKKHGIEQAGNVGPKTLKKLNELFGNRENHGTSTNSGRGNGHDDRDDDRDDDHDGDRDHASTTPGSGKVTICHKGKETIYVSNNALWAHIGHGDKSGACAGNNGGGSTTTPDTTAPVISGVTASGITTSAAAVLWSTNENATSRVEYGTSTSYGSFSALNASLSVAHNVVLTGLTPNTVYNFRVISSDAANNTATSSNMTFTTAALDTAAPVLSSIVSGSVATTTALISWTSSENATGKVYYGTANPLVLGSAATQSTATLSTGHSFPLSGLTASTTYYFVVESTDASNNTATSSQMSFTTTN